MSEGRQPTQALALLAPGRRPRAEEERPESSNIHPGLPGPGQGQCRGQRRESPWPRPPLLPGRGQIPAPSATAPGVVPHPRIGEGIMEQTAHLASRLFRSSQWKGRGSPRVPPHTGARPSTGCVASSGHASPWAFPRAVALPSPPEAAPNALWALTHRAMPLPRAFDLSTPK